MSESRDKAFAMECLKLEKAGGNVLEYIRTKYPSYSPWGVWSRLQKKYLKRSPGQITSGKPMIEKGEREDMGKTLATVQEAKAAYAKGESMYEFLRKKGYENPSAAWYWMKEQVSKEDYELYEWMTTVRIRQKKTKLEEGVLAEVKTEKLKEKPARPVTTCCAPAPGSGVTVPDEIPEETKRDDAFKKVSEAVKKVFYTEKPDPEPMEVIGVRSRVKGHYMKSEVVPGIGDDVGYVHLIWRDIRTMEERSLGLGVDEWLRLAEEIPKALKALGF